MASNFPELSRGTAPGRDQRTLLALQSLLPKLTETFSNLGFYLTIRYKTFQALNFTLSQINLVRKQNFNHLTIQPSIIAYRMRPTTSINTIFLDVKSTFAGSILVSPESSSDAFQPGSDDYYLNWIVIDHT